MALFGKKAKSKGQPEPRCACGGCGAESAAAEAGGVSGGDSGIMVLGAGCAACHELYENTRAAAAALGIPGEVAYVTDLPTIAAYGVLSVPALVVHQRVLSMGKVLKTEELQKLLEQAGI